MAHIIQIGDHTPSIHSSCWVAPDAVIAGDVTIDEQCSLWFKSVIRGDVCKITLGKRVNIQDGVVVHGTYKKSHTHLGDDVSVGHNATIHGCIIEGEALIGMNCVIMDNTVIEPKVIVAAGAVVLENQTLKSGYIYGGTPAKIIKELDMDNAEFFIHRTARNYIKYASWYPDYKHDSHSS